jgi:hypothetical protein
VAAEVLVSFEESAARWASITLEEMAYALRTEAQKVRLRGAGHLPIKPAALYVAEAYDRAANELLRAQAGIRK